jgi:poly-gamma-glutamate capsule biosynthesis protein CapA/YwtB (metallophosphatase superfamily)
MLGRLVNGIIPLKGFGYPWGNLLPVLEQADLFLINLECTLTILTQPRHNGQYKPFYFRADPPVVETLQIGRVNFASVANNHSGDFGMGGLLETLAILDQANITHAGAGPNLEVARAPALLHANALTVAVIAFADYPLAWAATPTQPGINYTPISLLREDFAIIEESLRAARQQADLVIFSIHWGPNMRFRPTEEFRAFARGVISAGADIFWGHSAHLVQGIEIFQGKPILYDTGDLVDDYAVDELARNDLSALFQIKVWPQGIERIDLAPVLISNMQANLAPERERAIFLKRLALLCDEMGTELETGPDIASVRIA